MKYNGRLWLTMLMLTTFMLISSGCGPSVQLNERAIVQAIGIDREGEGYRLSIQYFNPEGAGGQSAVDASRVNTRVVESSGKTIQEAISNAVLKQGKEMFYGQNKLILFGQQVAQEDVEPLMSFFMNNSHSSPGIQVAVAQGRAVDIIHTKIEQSILPADSILKLIENADQDGRIAQIRAIDFMKMLHNKQRSGLLPLLAPVETPSSEGKSGEADSGQGMQGDSVEVVGSAVFTQGRLSGSLSLTQTRGLNWVRDKIERSTMTVEIPGQGSCSLDVYETDTEMHPDFHDGEIVMHVKIHADSRIVELMADEMQDFRYPDILQVEQLQEQAIEEECREAVRIAIHECRSDVLNLVNIIRQKSESEWISREKRWDEEIARIQFDIDATCNIDRLGVEANDRNTER